MIVDGYGVLATTCRSGISTARAPRPVPDLLDRIEQAKARRASTSPIVLTGEPTTPPPAPTARKPGRPGRPRAQRDTAPIAAAYASGATMSQVAAQYGCSRATVQAAMAAHGVPVRHQRTALDIDALAARYRAGETLTDLAAAVGVDVTTIRRHFKAAGVLRPGGGRP